MAHSKLSLTPIFKYPNRFSILLMNWSKLLYTLIIVLLYVPMVFVGANVFFPEYTGTDSYYHGTEDCYLKYPSPAPEKTLAAEQSIAITEKQAQCQKDFYANQQKWEQEKLVYEGTKYVFITLFNLLILVIAVFLPFLKDSVALGLFLGSVFATFGATIRYFDTRSKIGFVLLVITFIVVIFFINRKKEAFWK